MHDEPNPPPIKDSQGQASPIGETDENARLVGENEDKSYSSSSGGLNTPSSEQSIEEKRKYLNNTTTWVLFLKQKTQKAQATHIICECVNRPNWFILVTKASSFNPAHKPLSYEIEKRGALAPIVQTLYSAICWINHYPADTCYEHQLCYPLDWIDINLVNSVIHLFNNWGQELIKDLSEYSAHALGVCDGFVRRVACLYCWLLHSVGSLTVDSF